VIAATSRCGNLSRLPAHLPLLTDQKRSVTAGDFLGNKPLDRRDLLVHSVIAPAPEVELDDNAYPRGDRRRVLYAPLDESKDLVETALDVREHRVRFVWQPRLADNANDLGYSRSDRPVDGNGRAAHR
jgi:hypothetical protein